MRLYNNKQPHYFTQVREDLIEHIPIVKDATILEVGAGGCDTLVAIKERKLAKEVVGIELFEMNDTNQNNPLIDKLFICNIEFDFPPIEENKFDAIICGDVLEHLNDPWHIVEQLSKYLKPQGVIIVSCPNIREIFTLSKILVRGTFKYEKSGILDKTHLRFFCKKDLVQMLTSDNMVPIYAKANYFITPQRGKLSKFHFNLLDDFLAPQTIVVSKRK